MSAVMKFSGLAVLYICSLSSLHIVHSSTLLAKVLQENQNRDVCPEKYSRISPNHTACLSNSNLQNKPAAEGVADSVQSYIVDVHNLYRSTVSKYNGQPEAANMQKMYWDEELAMVAQKWASNCIFEHDSPMNRIIPGTYAVGQNLGKGHRSWGNVIQHWQSEVEYLTFGKGKEGNKPVGHYTQMVWAETAKVGCGFARCNRTTSFYVCNYASAGNFINTQFTPYKTGASGSSCPDYRKSNLCDCGGKVCKNGGSLDLKTCQCKCLNKPWIEQDGDCSLNCAKADDLFICASKGGSWDESHCSNYVNVPHEFCPITCKLCPAEKIPLGNSTIRYPEDEENIDLGATATTGTGNRQGLKELLEYFSNGKKLNGAELVTKPESTTRSAGKTYTKVLLKEKDNSNGFTVSPAKSIAAASKNISHSSSTENVPDCKQSHEIAKCGQPSAKGYFDSLYCSFGLDFTCPAMCGKCKVKSCVDYTDKKYQVGEIWMNEYGKFNCTSYGVKVTRGCYIEKANVVIDEGQDYKYLDGIITWKCTCSSGYSLSCNGLWTKHSRIRY